MVFKSKWVSTTVKDMGEEHILKQIEHIGDGVEITTGIHKKDADNKAPDGDTPVIEYTAYLEYGTKDIKPRPFMRKTMDVNQFDFLKGTMAGMRSIYSGKLTAARLAERVRKKTLKWMRHSILTWGQYTTSDRTIPKKKDRGKRPLYDTTTMYKSISSEVKFKKGQTGKTFTSFVKHMKDLMKRRI